MVLGDIVPFVGDKVILISDIHIRRYDRHAEYELVFNNLYQLFNLSVSTFYLVQN